jgi:hypothetical protein
MKQVDKVKSLEELSDRQLLEIIFTSQVRINKRIIDIENSLKKQQGISENSADFKTYSEYINDLYASQYPIKESLEEYLKSANS